MAHDMSAAVERARAGVVSVLPVWQGRPANADEPEGSGIAVGDGRFVLTAAHVLGNATRIRVRSASGSYQAADIVAADRATDVALLSITASLRPLEFADAVASGDEVCAVGNAFGLGISATCGVVSATERSGVGFNPIEDFVQTDAAVNPGASGGALVNKAGEVVGLLSAIFTKQSDANIGVNFAVSAPLAERVFEDLRERGKVDWLVPGLRLERHPAPEETGQSGVRVVGVVDNGPAATAGIVAGDILIAADGRALRGPADLIAALARHRAPTEIKVVRRRDGHEESVVLRFLEVSK